MKKLLAVLLVLSMLTCVFAACGESKEAEAYEIAFVTDIGLLMDKSFNQGTWEGVQEYAQANGKTFKYYQPANGNEATDDDRYNAMKAAVDGGAKIVVCAGFLQATALEKAAKEFADVKFVFIDGWALGLENVMAIDFQEEQSGYLAGYAVVKDGYTKLGFSGGGGGENPACCRFGYGYVQGAQAAAAEMGVQVEINYSWEYGAAFSASPDLEAMLNGWYANGTEVVFACGGQMCKSAFAAAAANDGKVVGVDVDQAAESDTVITSAMKGLQAAVINACDIFYNGDWSTVGGGLTTLGVADDAVGLPTDGWALEKFTLDDYNAVYGAIKSGSIVVDRDYANLAAEYSNCKVNLD